ncbi:MAG: LPS-assembly protein LptD [Beijerinckiaceae bacterium]
MCLNLACATAGATGAAAQTLSDRLSQRAGSPAKDGKTDQMVVDAKELIYDKDNETVSASGNVQIYYRGRILQADRIIYNRNTKRVFAEGRVKLTEPDGTVAYGTRSELTDDFKDGFIDSLRAKSADNTHFTARRSERTAGDTTVFYNSTYTACEPCKKDPSRPPLWRVRAKRIIHKNEEQMIYYEDAVFELWGYPIAYLPYFSTPDPTVQRKSGFLIPSYIARSRLGVGASVPYFWALAPNYDMTITPTFLTKQGVLGQVQWRHRLVNGSYQILATGLFQQEPGAFLQPPYGPGNREFRGSLETSGEFHINTKWKFGWDVTLLSDRWFKQDYRLPSQNLSQNYLRDSISTLYLTGQGKYGFFDLRGYYFQGTSRSDIQSQQPIVTPVLDYNKTVDLSPERTHGIGGRLEFDFNFVNITRELASFEAIGGRRLDRAYGLYDVCETAAGAPAYNRTACLVRGMAGSYARATFGVEWKRKFIDPIGQVWTPFAFARFNGTWLDLNNTGSKLYVNPLCSNPATAGPFAGLCASQISNAFQNTFFNNSGTTFRGSATPGIGLEYRFPFIAVTDAVTHVLEPIAQLIVRPNESRDRLRVNEDAQSLVFDDTSLFTTNKFSGYDRFEGGTRVNYGVQYTATFQKGGYANLMVGQSFQVAGRNSYETPDAANVGLGSGLDRRYSDIVARAAFAPNSYFNFVAKARFDPDNQKLRRVDLMTNLNLGRFDATLHYARYDAQPLIGFDQRREGLLAGARYKIDQNFSVNGNVIFDLSRHLYNGVNPALGRAPLFSVAGLGLGASYNDECTTLAVRFTSILESNGVGATVRNNTVLFSLQLRTVGDTRVRSNVGASAFTNAATTVP